MPRAHNRDHFFKYVTADTAEKILSSGKLRWSAPCRFNDPFDHQVKYRINFTGEQAAKKIYEALERFLFGTDEPVIVQQTKLGFASLLLRKRNLQGKVKEDCLASLWGSAQEIASRLEEYPKILNAAFVNFLGHARILCVSENHENVVMRSHYSEKHRGAVIKLRCIDDVDDNLLNAKPVIYTDEFPCYLNVDDWVAEQFGEKINNIEEMVFTLSYIKHKDWSYEREWRVYIPLLPHEPVGDGISLYGKDPSVFGALYLGCRMPEPEQKKLIDIAINRYPRMEIYRASMSDSSFNLKFERIV